MDEKQLLYAVEIASSPDPLLRQQANDFLRDVAAQPDRYWTVRPFLLSRLDLALSYLCSPGCWIARAWSALAALPFGADGVGSSFTFDL